MVATENNYLEEANPRAEQKSYTRNTVTLQNETTVAESDKITCIPIYDYYSYILLHLLSSNIQQDNG